MFKFRTSNTNNGFVPRFNDRNKTTTHDPDHVHKPVIIDSEGRKHPIVTYSTPNHTETYVTETETIVQRVTVPATEYRYSSTADVLPLKPHKYVSPVRERPLEYRHSSPKKGTHSPYSEYGHSSPTKGTHSPYRYGSPTKHTNGTHSPYGEYKNTNGTHSPYGEYRHSSPTKVTPLPYSEYRQSSPKKTTHEPFHEYKLNSPKKSTHVPYTEYKNSSPKRNAYDPYDEYKHSAVPVTERRYGEEKWQSRPISPERPKQVDDFLNKVQTEVSRPNKFSPLSANVWKRNPNNNKGYNNGYGDYDDTSRNTNTGRWSRPNTSAWPRQTNTRLSEPTNDIGTAIETLTEAFRPTQITTTTNPPSRITVPVTRRDGYTDTFEPREGTRRYANFNLPPRRVDSYSNAPIIDSNEALRKYRGTAV